MINISISRHQLQFRGESAEIERFISQTFPESYFHYNDLIPIPEELIIDNGMRLDFAIDVVLSSLNPDNLLRFPPIPKLSKDLFSDIVDSLEHMDGYGPYYTDLTPNDLVDLLLSEDCHEILSLGMQALCNLAAYQHPDWYGWTEEHWGSSFDVTCSRCQPDKHLITFDIEDPLCFPILNSNPVLCELSSRSPSLNITDLQTSLITGTRTGIVKYQGGKVTGRYFPADNSKDAELISSYLLDFDPYRN